MAYIRAKGLFIMAEETTRTWKNIYTGKISEGAACPYCGKRGYDNDDHCKYCGRYVAPRSWIKNASDLKSTHLTY